MQHTVGVWHVAAGGLSTAGKGAMADYPATLLDDAIAETWDTNEYSDILEHSQRPHRSYHQDLARCPLFLDHNTAYERELHTHQAQYDN